MSHVSLVTNQLHQIGENLIRVNNLSAHIGIEIRALQFNLTKAIDDLNMVERKEETEPSLPDGNFTPEELAELHALETTRGCIISNWRGVEAKRRLIIDRARGRMNDQGQQKQDGGPENEK